jgi:hypothetical protein
MAPHRLKSESSSSKNITMARPSIAPSTNLSDSCEPKACPSIAPLTSHSDSSEHPIFPSIARQRITSIAVNLRLARVFHRRHSDSSKPTISPSLSPLTSPSGGCEPMARPSIAPWTSLSDSCEPKACPSIAPLTSHSDSSEHPISPSVSPSSSPSGSFKPMACPSLAPSTNHSDCSEPTIDRRRVHPVAVNLRLARVLYRRRICARSLLPSKNLRKANLVNRPDIALKLAAKM